ncbi:MAG: ABC transporter substrate-binding protein [Alphaproteobacteria bacterium]|nr:ABC transporter substrate-binding protein [Alphaproteobacteria bacterium]
MRGGAVVVAAVLALAGAAAAQDVVKVGLIGTYSGPFASWGPQFQQGAELYLAEHGATVGNAKIELLVRDDGGPNPDRAKQLAQELLVRDKVQFLAGVVFTPNALAIAPLATEAKVPFVIFNAATAMITRRSPYIVRTSFTLWQVTKPAAEWAIKNGIKEAFVAVSDYAPGHDARDAFKKSFADAGGQVTGELLIPLATTDFAPFVQRIKDAKPGAVYVFMPAGASSIGFMKAFAALGLREAGIKLLATGDTDEVELPAIGDSALGTITAYHYSPYIDTPKNQAWVAAYRQKFGADAIPNFASVAAYDGMRLIHEAVKRHGATVTGDQALAVMKGMRIDSPRGPLAIDPEERDVIQDVYIRRVERVGDKLGNLTIDRYPDQKDPWKILNK